MIMKGKRTHIIPKQQPERAEGLENLIEMEYPGRFFIVGRDQTDTYNVIVYGLTGRGPPSRARTLEHDMEARVVRTQVTDPAQLAQGNTALLIYPAIAFRDEYVAVSNGAQTELIYQAIANHGKEVTANPMGLMHIAFREPVFRYDQKNGWVDITSYEPDPPNNTPRIGAVVGREGAAFFIARKLATQDEPIQEQPRVFFEPSQGSLMSTYSGKNMDPLPSFDSWPLPVGLKYDSAAKTAHAVYDALAPRGGEDLRVAVACVFTDKYTNVPLQVHIENRY
jgi:IMP cyclohydrolase